ncbi:MAG: RHS repeat-associated core domain-containing protein, partial [Bacteroidota bacterium]
EYFYYDNYGRLDHLNTRIDGVNHHSYFEHNIYGDITKKIFPSGYDLNYYYDTNGYLSSIKRISGLGAVNIFTNQGMNGRRQYTTYKLGNNKLSSKYYNHGVPTRYYTQGVQDLRMGWTYPSGNMSYRWDVMKGRFESFTYDNLHRLKTSLVGGQPTKSINYHLNGNITSKTDVGNYSYPYTRNNAVTRVSNSSGTIPGVTQNITYTGFDQPKKITEGNFELTYAYGNDRERIKSTLKQNGTVIANRYYIGEYEKQVKNGVTQHLHYVDAGEGTVAIIERKNNVDKIYYTYTDHLGSIVTATDYTAAIQAEQNFDPWGRKRNVSTWSYTSVGSVPDWLYRGYTAHEHMPEFQLINMNGRLYDPVVGRMLSPDNNIQNPASTQNYNRYTYAFNNPLRYTDPSGEIVWAPIIIGAVIGAYSGGMIANGGNFNPFQWDFSSGRTWGFMLGGAIVGGLSAGIGHAVATSGMPLANTASIVSASFVNSLGMHIVTGGQTPVSVSFGIASYNFSSGEVGYLGKSGNTFIENVGYAFGAISNFNDIMVGFKPSNIGEVELVTEHSDAIGHSSIVEPGATTDHSIVSFGPGGNFSKNPLESTYGDPAWSNHITDRNPVLWRNTISGINKSKVLAYGSRLTTNTPKYNVYFSSCVTHTSMALMRSGFFNIGIHPFLLHAQVALRDVGFRSYLFSMTPQDN